jgi:hypothetical protein
MSKKFGEMTPQEQRDAMRRAADRLAAELNANSAAIAEVLDAELAGHPDRSTLCIGTGSLEFVGEALLDAVSLASDQDRATYLTDAEGKVIAAIVPVEQAVRGEVRL